MRKEILAIAIFEPIEGKEKKCMKLTRELCAYLRRKGYARDKIYRSREHLLEFFDVRYWASADAAARAHRDPKVHKFWARLERVCRIKKIYEKLEEVM